MPKLATAISSTPALDSQHQPRNVSERRRLTVEIPVALDRTLEMYCTVFGELKNEVTAQALSDFLATQKDVLIDRMTTTVAAAASGRASTSR